MEGRSIQGKFMPGFHHTDETKSKMSQSRKGKKRKPFSDEWKNNISKGKKGCKHTEEWKQKARERMLGNTYNAGKKHHPITEATRLKMRLARLKNPTRLKGNKNPCWKGGKCRSVAGYVWIASHNHPHCDQRGYVYEHRLIMESHLGRTLLSTEVVHHINGIKDDNRIENLMLFSSKGEHIKYHGKHKKGGEKYGKL